MRNRFLINSSILFAVGFVSLVTSYRTLEYFWHIAPIASFYRMHQYHISFFWQYIAIIALVFGILGAAWIKYFGHIRGSQRWLSIALIVIATVICSSPIGGVLWHFHDMQAGFVPETYINKLSNGLFEGLSSGWLLVIISFPLNLIGVIVAYISLHFLSKSYGVNKCD
jgi:H+/Cl- antiporter ClcA